MSEIMPVHLNRYFSKHILGLFLVLLFSGCATVSINRTTVTDQTAQLPFPGYENLNESDQNRADSLLAWALDHEALYSLMGDIKPISSIGYSLSYPLAKDSTHIGGDREVVSVDVDSIQTVLNELESWNRVLNALSFENYQFILVPFRAPWKGDRNMQVLICRTDLIDGLLADKASFFAQWGFVPGTNPAVLLTTTEFEERHDRYRAYGYLFGYPEHAVTFFVEASQEQQETGEFVQRSFFAIPVHERESGYFTYALPKGFEPLASDSATYYQSLEVLEEYRALRSEYLNEYNKVDAIQLYRDWWRRNKE